MKNLNWRNILKAAGILAVFISILMLIFSCSPYSRMQKKPPLTDKDTLNLATRCHATFPVRELETIRVVIDTVIDKQAVEFLSDQLRQALNLLANCQDDKGAPIDLDSFRIALITQLKDGIPPQIIYKTEYRDKIVKDSAEAVMWRKLYEGISKEIVSLQNTIIKKDTQIESIKEGRKKWTWYAISTWLLIVLYLIGRIKFRLPW